MSKVRVLVGTRKGAFILTSDEKREEWEINGPIFAGWEIFHMKGSSLNPDRIYASQSGGWFGQLLQRTDDGGQSWQPINRGLKSDYELPDAEADVGHCVHNINMHPSRPEVLFMQKHWDVMRSDNAGEMWHEVSGNLPSDFGFPIAVHAAIEEARQGLRLAHQINNLCGIALCS